MFSVDVIDANDQLIECSLDGQAYYLGLSWNEFGQLWTISVRDLNKQVLVSGIRVVPLFPLLRQVRGPDLPPGEIGVDCASETVLDRRAFADGLATLWYLDADDMAELAAQETPAVAQQARPRIPASLLAPLTTAPVVPAGAIDMGGGTYLVADDGRYIVV